jgi:hypothetical protein
MSLPDVVDLEFEARVAEIKAGLVGMFASHIDLDWVARQVAAAPPLTEEQCAALIPLLRVPASR